MENEPRVVVDRAIWVAKRLNCDIELLLFDLSENALGGIFLSNEAREFGQKIREALEYILEELAETVRESGIGVTGEVMEERPIGDAVMSRVSVTKPKFVMKGTHYHSDADRGIIVDTDWQLMRACPYPLWLVKTRTFSDEPVVVAAVDPTHEHDKPAALDDTIIAMGKLLTEPDGELHLLHTYQTLGSIGQAVSKTIKPVKLELDKLNKRVKEEHRKALDELAARNDIDNDHFHQLPGRPHELLPSFARSKNADLVVMGALARWGIKRMVIGSTAERVIDHLSSDVLIVREAAYP
jgi:universal stress protein E